MVVNIQTMNSTHVRCLESLVELEQMLDCSGRNTHFIINFPLNLDSFLPSSESEAELKNNPCSQSHTDLIHLSFHLFSFSISSEVIVFHASLI